MAPTILITGCTEGSIGYYLAKEFLSRGYHVFAGARRPESTGDLQKSSNVTVLALDMTDPASIQRAYGIISSTTDGKLDIVYNNAGTMKANVAIEISWGEPNQMFTTNLFGVIELNRVFADMVIAAKGKFIFTGSCAGLVPFPAQSVYNATKAALHAYINTLRLEMKPFGVDVINVITGGVKTPIWNSERIISEDSRYKPVYQKFEAAVAETGNNSQDPVVYARKVVGQVLKRNSAPEIWAGTGSSIFWFIDRLNLTWLYGPLLGRMYGLNSFKPQETKT